MRDNLLRRALFYQIQDSKVVLFLSPLTLKSTLNSLELPDQAYSNHKRPNYILALQRYAVPYRVLMLIALMQRLLHEGNLSLLFQ